MWYPYPGPVGTCESDLQIADAVLNSGEYRPVWRLYQCSSIVSFDIRVVLHSRESYSEG